MRNYGEPVHEDHDLLGVFSPYEYTHTKPGKGALQLLSFVAAVFGLCGVVSMVYPDKPSAPREFEGGLESELGGPNAVRVSCEFDDAAGIILLKNRADCRYRRELLEMHREMELCTYWAWVTNTNNGA